MRSLGSSGLWELFVPDLEPGSRYKYEIRAQDGTLLLKADPFAYATEQPPRTASVVFESRHRWTDEEWLNRRRSSEPHAGPLSVYELRYELDNRPDWVQIPVAGIARLLAAPSPS